MPCQIMRTMESSESLESRAASVKSPFSSAANTRSRVCGSRLRLSRHHQKMRSPTTATAKSPVIKIGHMMGPPCSNRCTSIFASIKESVLFQLKDAVPHKELICPGRVKAPTVSDNSQSSIIENSESGALVHFDRSFLSCFINQNFNSRRLCWRQFKVQILR